MTNATDAQRHQAAIMNTFGPPKLTLVKGQGAHVWDADGKEYVDFLGGIAVNSLGHAHPALVEAVTAQLSTLGHISNFFASPPQLELAERLISLFGCHPGGEGTDSARVFFSSSGAEANEAALKLTRRTGRSQVVAATGSFHGRTMGALSLTAKAAYREPFEPLPSGVTFVAYGDTDALRAAVTGETAAVVLEPIQGEAGVVVPPDGYLQAARAITAERGALLWLDEVQTGIGRTGDWFAHPMDLRPDVVTLAKGLGGGIPIGATLARGEAAHLLQPGHHGTTFGGNPVACAAALAVLDQVDPLLPQIPALGEKLRAGLAAPAEVTRVRGRGLLIGVETTLDSAAIVRAAQDHGFILNNPTPTTIRLAPPLVLTDEDADALVRAWPEILEAAR